MQTLKLPVLFANFQVQYWLFANFVAFRGSWNRDRGTGYKIVFVPFNAQGRPQNYYEDFLDGFLVDPAQPATWGRPVGLLVLPDGSLIFTEESNNRIYRIQGRDQIYRNHRQHLWKPSA